MWFRRENRSGEEADLAFEDAERKLRDTKRRTPEVQEIVRAHKRLQERNHFAEQLEDIILGHRRVPE